MISASTTLAIFMVSTAVYFIARYYVVDRHIDGKTSNLVILSVLYLAAVIGSQLVINIKNAAEICAGTPQVGSAMLYTLVPNFFILGTVMVLLSVLPGWKAPFSNTLGYLIVRFQGVSDSFSDILASKGSKLIEKICEDHSIIINQMTPVNFGPFLKRMARDGLLTKGWHGSDAEKNLWEYLAIKNLIAEFLWYTLTGAMVISTTYNALLDITCEATPQQKKAMSQAFAEKQESSKPTAPKYFTIHD